MDACIRIAERTRATAGNWGAHLYDLVLLAELAYCNLTAGRLTEARRYIQEFPGGLPGARLYDKGFLYFLLAWEAWLEGRLPEALATAQEDDLYARHFAELHPMGMTRLMWIQIEASRGNRAAALRHLGELRQWSRRVGSRIFEFARAQALAQLALEWGRPQRADGVLRVAFALARRGGYANLPFFRSETIARLYARALEAGIEVDYVRGMIRKRALKPPPEARSTELWPWIIKVTTLGGFSLRIDDKPMEWPRKARRKLIDLLKALIAFGGEQVPSAKLADELWPDAEGDASDSAFKSTLHRLRKLLGYEDAVYLRDGQVSINPVYVWLDLWALDPLLEEIESAAAHRSPDETSSDLEELATRIFSLYRGRFLDESELPCVEALRESLHRKFLRALETLGANFERMGLMDRAVSCYERGLEVDPVAEGLYQRLMSCYIRLGKRAEAMRVYQQCKNRLARELGVAPSAHTQQIYQEVLGI